MRTIVPFLFLLTACYSEVEPDQQPVLESDGGAPDAEFCAAVPSCGDGETPRASEADCAADTACREVTVCGETIRCESAGDCAGESPAGCTDDASCGDGFRCDHAGEGRPSACSCDPESGSWNCTPDLSGGDCLAIEFCAAVPSCADGETPHETISECPADASCREVVVCGSRIWCSSTPEPQCFGEDPSGNCVNDADCGAGERCEFDGRPSACTCDVKTASWTCTADLGGGTCVPEA